jgi:hypothetical protein
MVTLANADGGGCAKPGLSQLLCIAILAGVFLALPGGHLETRTGLAQYLGDELAGQPADSDLPFEPCGFTSKSLARNGRDSRKEGKLRFTFLTEVKVYFAGSLVGFDITRGEENGRYLTQSEKDAVVANKGIPANPLPR